MDEQQALDNEDAAIAYRRLLAAIATEREAEDNVKRLLHELRIAKSKHRAARRTLGDLVWIARSKETSKGKGEQDGSDR